MKRSIIIFAILIVASSVVFAALWKVDNKQAPPISLPDAYQIAATALGSATNEFHCTSAEFIGSYCAPGSWMFRFYNTNGSCKAVFACPDGSVHFQDGNLLNF